MRRTLSAGSCVVAARDQVSSDLGGEVAILDLQGGTYYGLDAVGARVWELIQEPRTIEAIRDTLVSEYEVESDRCESDVIALIQRLVKEGLAEVRDETST